MVLLFVKRVTGQVLSVDLDVFKTVRELKDLVAALEGFPVNCQRLIFAGRVLKDESTLASYNIQKECQIQLFTSEVIRSRSASSQLSPEPEECKDLDEIPESEFHTSDIHTDNELVSDSLQIGDNVTVHLVEGRNLMKADFWTGSSDPYVIFAMGNNSAKSKIIKRNLNPLWNELFGFRLDPTGDNAIMSILVFDFDNFTPDDFIGSAEVNLGELRRNDVVDCWVKLENVKTGELHLKFRRSILTSPSLNAILTYLMELERSWQESDLQRCGVTLAQLSGDEAWNVTDPEAVAGGSVGASTLNPAIEHLATAAVTEEIDWRMSTLKRIEKILVSQNMVPTPGPPCSHLWFSGLSFGGGVSKWDFVRALRDHSVVKYVHVPRRVAAGTSHIYALVDFRSIREALLVFLAFQHHPMAECRVLVGFGRNIRRDDPLLLSTIKAGFVNFSTPAHRPWRYCWIFVTNADMHVFRDLQSDVPLVIIHLPDCFVCTQGPNTLELRVRWLQKVSTKSTSVQKTGERKKPSRSYFIECACVTELSEWRDVLRCAKKGKAGFDDLETEKEDYEESMYECVSCERQHCLENVYICDTSTQFMCIPCLREKIMDKINSGKCKSLTNDFSIQDVRSLLTPDEFNQYLDATLKELLETYSKYVKCPKCDVAAEFLLGDANDAPDFNKLQGIDNRSLSSEAQLHYLEYRLRCRNAGCSVNFCRSCKTTPYHTGFDCDEFEMYKNAKHCRFCSCALMPKTKTIVRPARRS
eukprot:232908_1